MKVTVKAVPVVVGALRTISKKLELHLENGGIEVSEGLLQKGALLRIATRRLLRE